MTIECAFENSKIDAELKELGGTRPADMRLPDGFCLNEKGQLCAVIHDKPVKGVAPPPRLLWLIGNRIGPPRLQFQNGHFGIGFTASTDRTGTTEVFLTSTQCYTAHGLLKQLPEKAVMYNPDKLAKRNLKKFAVLWMTKLSGS